MTTIWRGSRISFASSEDRPSRRVPMKRSPLVALLLIGLLGGRGRMEAAASAQATEEPDDVRVYSALIQQHYGRSIHRPLVIDATPLSGFDRFTLDDSLKRTLAAALAPLSEETLASYASDARRERVIESRFSGGVPCRIISQAALDTIFSQCPRGWDLLSERYPGCHGYVTFSNVGFGPGGDEAIVYTEDHCGVVCGEGTFVYLRKIDDVWRVEKKLTLWID
jgi:hypothetical protein